MEATPSLIINYFSGFKQSIVPLFQRPYTWSERQWRILWDDIVAFYGNEETDPKSTHFMGAIVTMPARSVPVGVTKFLLIDGQQRLTTVAILLASIRDDLTAGDEVPKRRIQQFYLTNDGFDGLDFLNCFQRKAIVRLSRHWFITPDLLFRNRTLRRLIIFIAAV